MTFLTTKFGNPMTQSEHNLLSLYDRYEKREANLPGEIHAAS